MDQYQLDELDKKILSLIAGNARIAFLEVARQCNISGAAIHQRVQKLSSAGVIKGSMFLLDPELLGYHTCAYVGLNLKDPSSSAQVVEALKGVPEVVECHVTTGEYDLFVKVYAQNNHHLHMLIHEKLQPLGLSSSKTLISFAQLIERQLPVPE